MAYGCAGSSPAFRTISKGNNDAKLLFPFHFLSFLSCENRLFGIVLVSERAVFSCSQAKIGAARYILV